ncbi:barstar family protein [Motilimonas eburnea]|uniref:barstar family protein n=1 Tax=Motilimonas eburnea TaxID=1737488 RepID=UPI001E5A3492|nr:barstar family protein [Motilimonas eburnea]MCE2573626.1 barstar family protein [Motilimonas eburnea]
MRVYLDLSNVYDFQDFHAESFRAFKFTGFYDHDMESWTNAMINMIEDDDELTGIYLTADEHLTVLLEGTEMVINHCPEVLLGFMEAVALVNQRFADEGVNSRIRIIPS